MSDFNTKEKELIQKEFDALLDICHKCSNEKSRTVVTKAFEMARDAHDGVRRKSGEPYIFHPLEVARIAGEEIGLGSTGIAAALLHDVIEDTDYTYEDIKDKFGEKIANIVQGLTKLNVVFDKDISAQAENFRKLFLTMIEDIRVVLIKLADRLHNMRTLDSMPEHKKLKIAGETLFMYAPVALRLGLYSIKTELEDLSFKHEHPMLYKEITEKIENDKKKNTPLIKKFILPIEKILSELNIKFKIIISFKTVYSIWNTMQKLGITLDEIQETSCVKIIFEGEDITLDKAQCWNIYSLITDLYKPKPDKLRDFVSTPKANGYESLHATVMSSEGKWIQIQIRSKRMDEIARKGISALKEYSNKKDVFFESDKWLKSVREALANPATDSLEFLDDFKLNLFSSEIMVFTPKGNIISLPKGATILDFAFDIHTHLGYKCIGAKVNYKLQPISYELKSGDQVEILTSEKHKPEYSWLKIVKTAKAKTAIKSAFKEERKKAIASGEELLQQLLQDKKLTINNRILGKILRFYNIEKRKELYFLLGKGEIDLTPDLSNILSEKSTKKWIKYWTLSFGGGKKEKKKTNKISKSVTLDDKTDQAIYEIAPCCSPIPGDDVVGYVNDENKVILHRRNCELAIKLMSSQGDKIVSANWMNQKMFSFLATINVSGIGNKGIIHRITSTITSDEKVNLRSINIDIHDGIFEGYIKIYVHDKEDLSNIIKKLKLLKGMHNVNRNEKVN